MPHFQHVFKTNITTGSSVGMITFECSKSDYWAANSYPPAYPGCHSGNCKPFTTAAEAVEYGVSALDKVVPNHTMCCALLQLPICRWSHP